MGISSAMLWSIYINNSLGYACHFGLIAQSQGGHRASDRDRNSLNCQKSEVIAEWRAAPNTVKDGVGRKANGWVNRGRVCVCEGGR